MTLPIIVSRAMLATMKSGVSVIEACPMRFGKACFVLGCIEPAGAGRTPCKYRCFRDRNQLAQCCNFFAFFQQQPPRLYNSPVYVGSG